MRALSIIVFFAMFLPPWQAAQAAIYTVGRVLNPDGTPTGCTHNTIGLAGDAAALNEGPDEIRVTIAAGPTHNGGNIFVPSQTVVIRGGYINCAAATPSGRTLLNGTGGLFGPVLMFSESGDAVKDIVLEGFELVEGDNTTSNLPGGGVHISGRGRVEIKNVRIANNTARQGAGIGIAGAGANLTTVIIGDGVQVEDNRSIAGLGGGGLLAYNATVILGGVDTVVRRNQAIGDGGGIYFTGNAGEAGLLVLQSGGQGADGLLSDNLATRGGGLFVAGGTGSARVQMYTSNPIKPLRFDRNRANMGGAVAVHTGAEVEAWDVMFDTNEASERGGTFSVSGSATLNLSTARFTGAPAAARSCAVGQACNRIIASRAPRGAVLSASQSNVSGLLAKLQASTISLNEGETLFDSSCDLVAASCPMPANLQLQSVLIANNSGVTSVAKMAGGMGLECDLCTLNGIGIDAQPNVPMFDSNGAIAFTRSILFVPGNDLIGGAVPLSLSAAHLLVHDASDFPGNTTVRVADPEFQNPVNGNFRLSISSPALDSAPVTADSGFGWNTPASDLEGKPRVLDVASIPNVAGLVDLGALELDPDALFANGFE